ncbi:DCC1-like thiol-disulfide oxidoreductase family protein [Rheinheimera gaetbuli]
MTSTEHSAAPAILLIYDKDCPACNAYCQLVRVRQTVGELQLINAREDSDVMRELTAQGLDIDQGMVLKMADNLYYGSDAIYMLSLLSSRSGLFNRLNYHLFKSRRVAAWLYPLLRACRNLLLKLLGKRKINNLNISGNDRF